MILLRNAMLFSPHPEGRRDILVGGGQILAAAARLPLPDWEFLSVIDLEERWVIPGLVDSHIHIAGAGGEGGPVSRTGPVSLDAILDGGITSLVGCLGTDGITRSVESVLMQAKYLRQAGLSAWIYTGAYQVPPPTILGDVARDIAMIEEVIGVGEIALADHRSSRPTERELLQLALRARLGGMLGSKAGIVNIHLGDQSDPFDMLERVARLDGIGHHRFLPTHCNRSRSVLEKAVNWGRHGYVDLTASSFPFYPDVEVKPSRAARELLDRGVPLDHITISSDAGGSLPQFDARGRLVRNALGNPATLLQEAVDLAENLDSQLPAFAVVTANPAAVLGLPRKGRLSPGMDADLVVLDTDHRKIFALMAGGRWMRSPGDSPRQFAHKFKYKNG